MYVGNRMCFRPMPQFKDVFFQLDVDGFLNTPLKPNNLLWPVPGCLQRSVRFLSGVGVVYGDFVIWQQP